MLCYVIIHDANVGFLDLLHSFLRVSVGERKGVNFRDTFTTFIHTFSKVKHGHRTRLISQQGQ